MPLDTGGMSDLPPTIHSGHDVGQALRLMREHQGLTLEALAETTRVRASYLAAIEELALDKLPSRPFTIGYIRSYATILGADPDLAVERFKADEPVLDEPLRAPVGVMDERDPRLTALIVGMCLIIAAIVLYNVAQRAMMDAAPPPPTAPEVVAERALAATKSGTVALGEPLPAPVESTTPPPYETPGIERAIPVDGGKFLTLDGQPKPIVQPADSAADLALPPIFTPAGAIYGAPANQLSYVTLQALRPVALIVRGGDGSVYFARQMNKGEAYRVPQLAGLTADVSEPNAFQVFVSGQSRGTLKAPRVVLASLAG